MAAGFSDEGARQDPYIPSVSREYTRHPDRGQDVSEQSLTPGGGDLVEAAPAKLNLGLRVLSQRQDGFHDLIGLFQTVSLADRLRVRPSARLEVTCSDPGVPSGARNLAYRAADLYLREAGGSPCRMHIEKAIPVAAGLGGGSSDAAAVLRVLDRASSRPVGMPALVRMAEQLGSDVPFALAGGTAVVEGRGERLRPLRWSSEVWYVLVCPPVAVDTGWAYAELDRHRRAGSVSLSEPDPYRTFLEDARGGLIDASRLWSVLHNDFQPVVERAKPIVAQAGQLLAATDPLARSMSGSGATVYGIYDDRTAADRAAERLREAGFPVFLCTPFPPPPQGGRETRQVARSFNW